MKIKYLTTTLLTASLLAACAEEAPPTTVSEFRENPNLLEAQMVYCGQNRSSTKYEVECVNARQAINLIARADANERRADLEAQSERKRNTLRRTQEAASEARRRAAEAERMRREAEYLAQFESIPAESGTALENTYPNEVPVAVAPTNTPSAVREPQIEDEARPDPGSDLTAIREELERRQN